MRVLLVVVVAGCGSVKANKPVDANTPPQDAKPIDGPGSAGPDAATCAATPSGLGGRWRGEMNTTDDTGNSTGTTEGTSFTYIPGKHGYAFGFDGSTNAVEINDGDKLWPQGSFTIEAWVNTHTGGAVMQKYQCSFSCPAGDSTAYWALSLAANGNPSFGTRTDAALNMIFATDSVHDLRDGQWHYLVGVRDTTAKTDSLFVDGQLAASAALADVDNGPMTNLDGEVDPISVGAGITGGTSTLNGFFTGGIDEVAYYSAALTPAQIAAIYAAPQGECH